MTLTSVSNGLLGTLYVSVGECVLHHSLTLLAWLDIYILIFCLRISAHYSQSVSVPPAISFRTLVI